jgi:biotin synthase
MTVIRTDWSIEEIKQIYYKPLLDLIYEGSTVHRKYHKPNEIQVCTLLSVKTGGCPEDCAYCPQSVKYQTGIDVHKLMSPEEVIETAKQAKANGSTRFCMGAAWREVRNNKDFDKILEMIKGVHDLGLEVCCTLGMVTEEQAIQMKNAGLHAYNHNLDTSQEFYDDIITTRTYQDRLKTLTNVAKANISICCGGIIGMGESHEDRIHLLHTLATLPKHPESVPINALVPVEGTPLQNQKKVEIWDMLRMIATARIIMPLAKVRLSAGRVNMSMEEQALCFLAGANSIFAGDKLLTTPNNTVDFDKQMFEILGLTAQKPLVKTEMTS